MGKEQHDTLRLEAATVPPSGQTVRVLGIDVDGWTPRELIEAIIQSASGPAPNPDGRLSTVHYANPHVLNLAVRNEPLRRQLRRASTVYCDGVGVRVAARLLGSSLPPRLAAADLIHPFCEAAGKAGVPVFLLGGAEGVAEQAARRLTKAHPHLRIVGHHHGFLDDELSERVVDRVNRSDAGVLVVGMGTPTQELWIGRVRERIRAPVVWSVGALMDFVVGKQRRAPAWMRRMHLEWLWRLGTDPVRLGGRYLAGNPRFLFSVAKQALGNRRNR